MAVWNYYSTVLIFFPMNFKDVLSLFSQESEEFPDSDFGLLNYGKFFLFLEENRPAQESVQREPLGVHLSLHC
jgi:hypothetical protein